MFADDNGTESSATYEIDDIPPFVYIDDDIEAVHKRESESEERWVEEVIDFQFEHFKAVWTRDMTNAGHEIVDVLKITRGHLLLIMQRVSFALNALYNNSS